MKLLLLKAMQIQNYQKNLYLRGKSKCAFEFVR